MADQTNEVVSDGVVGMGAFTNPHNPDTASGSVNFPLEKHPVEHSDDYGKGLHGAVDEDVRHPEDSVFPSDVSEGNAYADKMAELNQSYQAAMNKVDARQEELDKREADMNAAEEAAKTAAADDKDKKGGK